MYDVKLKPLTDEEKELNTRLTKSKQIKEEITSKEEIKRVRITEKEAAFNNSQITSQWKYYELVEEEKKDDKTPERIVLEKKATELEITFRANIGDDKLQEKVTLKEIELNK